MIADPKPQESILPFDGEGTIFERNPCRPYFMASALAHFLELQRRMLTILLYERKLFVRPRPNCTWQIVVPRPKTGGGVMVHWGATAV
jgi:hypothetical protein